MPTCWSRGDLEGTASRSSSTLPARAGPGTRSSRCPSGRPNGTSFTHHAYRLQPAHFQMIVGDVSGDFKSDIVFYQPGSAIDVLERGRAGGPVLHPGDGEPRDHGELLAGDR